MAKGSTRKRTVSFWYAPASYGGMDINNTVNLLAQHPGVVSTVLVYCGHSANGGLKVDAKTLALCTDGVPHAGQPPLLQALKRQGIAWELVLDSGSSDVDDYRASLFANASVVPALVSSPRRKLSFGARGWNFDLEPQKHKPASTAHDALAFASFCARTRSALHAVGMRLTVSVAQWCPMLKNYTLLAPTADRLFDMETYNANSFDGWLHGDSFGGYYLQLLNGTNHSAVAPALGCWNQTCGGQPCWTSTQPSVRPRLERMARDGIQEVPMFRLLQRDGVARTPQDWWWPALTEWVNAA